MRKIRRDFLLAFVGAMLLGLLSFCLPVWLFRKPLTPAPLFPVLVTGVEAMSWLTFLLLFLSGVILGLTGVRHALVLGLGTILPLVAAAIAEMIVSPTSHNLWSIEFVIYLLISLVAAAGVPVGGFLNRRVVCGKTTRNGNRGAGR